MPQAFCSHWRHAPMLQQTLDTLEREFADDSDASIDAAKALVEYACRLLVEELDDPAAPLKPAKSGIPLAELLGLATRMLDLGEVRDRAFATLIKEHNRLAGRPLVLQIGHRSRALPIRKSRGCRATAGPSNAWRTRQHRFQTTFWPRPKMGSSGPFTTAGTIPGGC